MDFNVFVAVWFQGFIAVGLILATTACAVLARLRWKAKLGAYSYLSLSAYALQVCWAGLAIYFTVQHSISSEACDTARYGLIAFFVISAVDIIVLNIVCYLKRPSLLAWFGLFATALIFAAVMFCIVLRSALLCTV